MKTIREQLEPDAQNSNNSIELSVQASIAISLKRVADVLEAQAKLGAFNFGAKR